MYLFVTRLVIAVSCLMLVTCGGGTILVESTPKPDSSEDTEPVPPPNGTFAVSTPEVEWTPATISSGLGSGLVTALSDRESVALVLPRKATALLEDRVFQMVKVSAPKIQVVARGRVSLDNLMEERGEIPYRVTMQQGGVDVLGRPYYVPKEHPLNTDWLARKKPLKGAQGMLTVRPIRVNDTKLKQMREGRQGGCAEFEKVLGKGLEQGVEFFQPYERAVSDILLSAFTRHLKVALPYWRQEMDGAAREVEPDSAASRCLEAYRSLIDSYEPCLSGACTSGLQFHRLGSGIIGMVDGGLLIPENCPVQGMRDYQAEIEDLAMRAASEALPALDNGWVGELVRNGGLRYLKNGISEICIPRHRRLEPKELNAARAEVRDYLNDLGGRDFTGEWESARGMERIPGIGPVRIFARVRVSGNDPVAAAAKLVTRLRRIGRCDTGSERLFQAALIDVGTSEVVFMGIFFEEELLCDGLPPGSP
ncbi:MAG: hypothetical protein GY847_12725 [Proteobacteria bacterium]|nr:hypothetical protein [Pseudomonadota bacterium]